ncbi:lipocalin family protein [Psychroserpens jangbogonensis]|uniref:lipocalin family protein n=1 Tax=Psychroserpens jangbogonensis TaxID=1484460 RepID=UPI00053D51B1|nr:lipocalin family protein [Psychroserpens jangbogonensis]
MKQVKKITRIFLVLTLGLIFSCDSDDDNTDTSLTNAELIIGSWTWTAQSENALDSGPLSECELLETFIYDGMQVEQIDYSGSPCTQAFTSTENYSIDGNILTFSDINDATDFYSEEIIELNATTLKLRYEETFNSETSIYIDTYTKAN